VVASKVELVVLGLLTDEPRHGYELLERFRALRMGEWVGMGRASVYQALERLERRGWIVGRAVDGAAGPDRRVVKLTRAGRAAFAEAVTAAVGSVEPYETTAGTALGFLSAFDPATRGRVLTSHEATLRARDAALRADRPDDRVARVLLDRQIALLDAELRWLKAARATLSR
jgi:DNA-binding PadR family transcriptional regulator